MVTELGARAFPYLSASEQEELNHIVYSKENGFADVILGNLTTIKYRDRLLCQTPEYHNEINTLLSIDGMRKSMPLKPEMVELAHTLSDGGYKVYFLSDMIDVTYDYLHDFLNSFSGGAYSFQEHVRKPDPAFYQILIKRYSLEPQATIFFDDRLSNVTAAEQLGIQAVVFHDKNDVVNSLHPRVMRNS